MEKFIYLNLIFFNSLFCQSRTNVQKILGEMNILKSFSLVEQEILETNIKTIDSKDFTTLQIVLNSKIDNAINRYYLSNLYEKVLNQSKKNAFENADEHLLEKILKVNLDNTRLLNAEYDNMKLKLSFYLKNQMYEKHLYESFIKMNIYKRFDSTDFVQEAIKEFTIINKQKDPNLDSLNIVNSLYQTEKNNCAVQLIINASDVAAYSSKTEILSECVNWLDKAYSLNSDLIALYEKVLILCKMNQIQEAKSIYIFLKSKPQNQQFEDYDITIEKCLKF